MVQRSSDEGASDRQTDRQTYLRAYTFQGSRFSTRPTVPTSTYLDFFFLHDVSVCRYASSGSLAERMEADEAGRHARKGGRRFLEVLKVVEARDQRSALRWLEPIQASPRGTPDKMDFPGGSRSSAVLVVSYLQDTQGAPRREAFLEEAGPWPLH
jgi:hypothetical protein